MHDNIKILIEISAKIINEIGYLGIFIGMFIESTIIPLPSELVMIPAGIACAKNMLNIYLVIFFGIFGNVAGAVFSYYLASSIGRSFLFKCGKYFLFKPATIIKMEDFFKKHGSVSIFFGRLIPGFRHFISLPAGIARMNMKLFFIYTLAGSSIWTIFLTLLGYFIGENQDLIHRYLREIINIIFSFFSIFLIYYFFFRNKFNLKSPNKSDL